MAGLQRPAMFVLLRYLAIAVEAAIGLVRPGRPHGSCQCTCLLVGWHFDRLIRWPASSARAICPTPSTSILVASNSVARRLALAHRRVGIALECLVFVDGRRLHVEYASHRPARGIVPSQRTDSIAALQPTGKRAPTTDAKPSSMVGLSEANSGFTLMCASGRAGKNSSRTIGAHEVGRAHLIPFNDCNCGRRCPHGVCPRFPGR
jgi:hypothetical protein